MMTALNVVVRFAVIVVGALMLLGVLSAFPPGSPLNETFGIIVVLFGLYRMVQYVSLRQRREPDDGNDEDDS